MLFSNKNPRQKKYNKVKSARVKRRTLAKINLLIYPFLIVLVFSSFYWIINNWDLFTVKNYSISGTSSFVNRVDLLELLKAQTLNKNIYQIDLNYNEQLVLQNFKGAMSVEIKRRIPSTLIIEVTERDPLALITNADTDEFYLVDAEGYVLGLVDKSTTNLPKVVYNEQIQIGEFIDANLVPLYLELLTTADQENLSISSAMATDQYLTFALDNEVRIFISTTKDVSQSVKIASALINQLKLDGEVVKVIDLRYDKVVVEF